MSKYRLPSAADARLASPVMPLLIVRSRAGRGNRITFDVRVNETL
jgi:hypothetical protein